MAVGFETTAPSTANVLLNEPPENFSILCCHRTIPHALKSIVDMGEIHLDGFIQPGHVSTIIGSHPYDFLSTSYHIPQVIAGFQPMDLLMAAWMLVKQQKDNEAYVQNEYTRAVSEHGNQKAQEVMNTVFEPVDIKWRGFPIIPQSGLQLKASFEDHDARVKYEKELEPIQKKTFQEPKGCRCGELLRGVITPNQCSLFGTTCTPQTPVGPCMVSAEGSCHISYKYGEK
jgi:hydrogenase expression/formation protein HypD